MNDMACEHARLLLSHQLDGGLNALDTSALDRHLAQCGDCRAAATDFWRQDRLLMELHARPLVEELASRVRQQLQRSSRRRPLPRWALASSALVAAGLLLAVVIPLALRPADPARPAPPSGIDLSQVRSGDVLVDGLQSRTVGDGSSLQVVGDRPAVVRLTDGSEAEFQPGTTALVHGREAGARPWIELSEGSGTFRVEKSAGEFQVTTQVGRVTALGTEFSVGLWPSPVLGDLTMKMRSAMLAVAVMSGMVQVEFEGQTFVLGGGESRVFGQDRVAAPAEAAGDKAPGDRAATPAEGRARVPAEGRAAAAGERGARAPSFSVRGTIESVDKAKVTLKTRAGTTDYVLAPDAVVTIDGKPAKVEELAAGMMVMLDRKEEAGSVNTIKAEGPTIGGEFKSVSADGKTITVSIPSRREASPNQTYALADDVVVRLQGREPAKVSELQPGMTVVLRLTVDKKTVVTITRTQPRGEGDTGARRGERNKPDAAPGAPPATRGTR